MEKCDVFFKKATLIIKELSLEDVLNQLKSRIICEDEMIELLKWWISYYTRSIHIGDQVRALNTFWYYLISSVIAPDVDLPFEVLPYSISKNIEG